MELKLNSKKVKIASNSVMSSVSQTAQKSYAHVPTLMLFLIARTKFSDFSNQRYYR